MKIPLPFVFAFFMLSSANAETGRRVMSWVPPYAVDVCERRLKESFDGIGANDGLTHLGLQFWSPTREGRVQRVKRFKPIKDVKIAAFREWGKAHDVRIMLCIYNSTPKGWDWKLAEAAFGKHRTPFIEAIIQETIRLQLDGVDIDLEGEGNQESSREAFVQFIRELSARLRAKKLELTVNTFASKWHAPNQTWWQDLLPHVNGLQVMGYSETGADAEAWRAYSFLKSAAGKHASRLLIGMPSNVDQWQGRPVREHLRWIVDDRVVGMAMWDSQLKHRAWRTKETWQFIAKVKGSHKTSLREGEAPAKPVGRNGRSH